MIVLWGIMAALFLVVELITIGMVSIWFMVGAIAALIAAALGAALWLQIVLFLIISAICFALLYPKLKNMVRHSRSATNADMVIGQTCVVTQRIDNIAGTGTVSVGGKIWSARTSSDETVEEGTLVRVEQIQGVKLIVTSLQETLVD